LVDRIVLRGRMAKKSKKYPSDELDQSLVRWPRGMRKAIEQNADRNGRSINAEIISLVQLGLLHSLPEKQDTVFQGTVSAELVQDLLTYLDAWRKSINSELVIQETERQNSGSPSVELLARGVKTLSKVKE
jgi:hypothetical protein